MSGSSGAGSQNSKIDRNDVTCPVCLDFFNNPHYVCANHHSLCLACYKGFVSSSGPREAKCPLCKENLRRPVENYQLRILVAAAKAAPKDLTGQTNSQKPPCEALENGAQQRPCGKPSMRFCEHCDRNLCGLHYSDDRLLFQAEFESLITAASKAARLAKTKAKLLSDWKDFYGERLKQLESLCKVVESELAPKFSEADITGQIDALKTALDFDDIQAAAAASKKLGPAADSANMKMRQRWQRLCQQLMKRQGCNPTLLAVKFQKEILPSDATNCSVGFKMNSDWNWNYSAKVELSNSNKCKRSGDELEIQFNYMATFNYSFQKLPDKELHVAIRLCCSDSSPLKVPFCNTVINLGEHFAQGDIKDKTFKLEQDKQTFGSIKLSTNIPSVARTVLAQNSAVREVAHFSTGSAGVQASLNEG
uniref:RING-type domain-containing protein n=1 Tax=Macrostomum lignano TaxID=282301 RepID=A0A1I8GQ13_9PLAT